MHRLSFTTRVAIGRRVLVSLSMIFASVFGGVGLGLADERPAVSAQAIYQLGAGDRLRITVYNEPTLSGEFTVSDTGVVDLPLVGSVTANGLTVPSLQVAVTKAFADGYVNNPKVSIEVLSYRPFYILGEVNKPGEYPYSVGMTMSKAVAIAGGFTYRANQKHVLVKRSDRVDEDKVTVKASTPVLPGDTVTIPERHF